MLYAKLCNASILLDNCRYRSNSRIYDSTNATPLQNHFDTTVTPSREEEISEDTLKMVFGDDYKEMLEDEGDDGLVHTNCKTM
jgi:trans-2-enoyl-CoA reductase